MRPGGVSAPSHSKRVRNMLSCRKYVLILGLVALAALPAEAQSARPYLPADESDVQKLIADRTQFVQDIYQPSAEDAAKILDAMRDLEGTQAQYQRQSALSLSRLNLSYSIVYHDTNRDPAKRTELMKRFERQFHNILAKAPLSLRNVVRIAEATLTPDVATKGRAAIAQKLATQATQLGETFDIERIDGIAYGALVPGPRPEIQLPERPTAQPLVLTPDKTPAAAPANTPPSTPTAPPAASPAQPAPAPIQPTARDTTPPPPPAPPTAKTASTVLPPAPVVSEWKNMLNAATQKYGYNPAQMEAAQNVINQSMSIAEKHRAANAGAYAEVEKMPDSPEKAAKLKTLNEPLDKVYDTMVKRMESIASLEQRNRAAANEKSGK